MGLMEQLGSLVNHEAKHISNFVKTVAENGDVHVCYATKDESGRHKIVHQVSKDQERTWVKTPDKDMEDIIQNTF